VPASVANGYAHAGRVAAGIVRAYIPAVSSKTGEPCGDDMKEFLTLCLGVIGHVDGSSSCLNRVVSSAYHCDCSDDWRAEVNGELQPYILKIKESLVSGEGYINPDMRHIAVGTVLTGRMIENEIEKGKIFKGTMLDTIHDDKIQVGLVTAFANSQESKDLLKNNKNLKDIAKKMDDKSLDEMVMSVANRVSSKGKSKKEKALATESIQQTKEKKTNKVLGS
jgi:hypothetical protein